LAVKMLAVATPLPFVEPLVVSVPLAKVPGAATAGDRHMRLWTSQAEHLGHAVVPARRVPTVDHQGMPGDERRVRRQEEGRR
jgi:hypothetical protein